MGELVAFRRRKTATARTGDIGPGGAEILFFLGVRYERRENAIQESAIPEASIAGRHNKRNRDGGGVGKTPGPGKRRA